MATKKRLNVTKPVFDTKGDEVEYLATTKNGTHVFVRDTHPEEFQRTDVYGQFQGVQKVVNVIPETVEYLSLYPTGNVYRKDCCPVRQSSYNIKDDLIQIKVTRRGDKIVRKEFC